MCSIGAWCSVAADKDKLKEALEKTYSRGPDDGRVIETPGGVLGFRRLSIMGLTSTGMQPFERDGCFLVCNGEIYGFEKIREELQGKGYSFQSESDCEVLLPLYFEQGTGMFAGLDAEFACVIYDRKNDAWIAARDPIGIRPLYYGYDNQGKIVFASEAKSLIALVQGKIFPFPPGHYYRDGEFVCFCNIAAPREQINAGLTEVCGNIRKKLISGVEKRLVADAKVGFLLSGGLDSSLVCSIAAKKLDAQSRMGGL